MEFVENHLNFFPYSLVLYELVGWTVGWFVGIRMFLLICSYLYRLRQWSKFKWQGGPDQWAIVVGATGALGRQYAKKLLDKDYNLLLISNNDAKLEDIKMILMKMKHNKLIKTHVMDLRKDDDSMQATGIGGGRGGYFWYTPPWPKIFRKYPPLEILGKFFEKPGKTEKIR